jgi:hypothetical protein
MKKINNENKRKEKYQNTRIWSDFSKEGELFELLMDSVCKSKGIDLTNQEKERVDVDNNEEFVFKNYMESLKVKPLKREEK